MTQGRLGKRIIDPDDPLSIAEVVTELIQIVTSELGFGDPLDPSSDASTVKAGQGSSGTDHNGTPDNILGAWAEAEFTSVGVGNPVTFSHNLGLPVQSADSPNVRWLFTNIRHSGAGAPAAADTITLMYDDAVCTTAADTIQLVCHAATGGRTIDGSNPVKVSVFFVPVLQWL